MRSRTYQQGIRALPLLEELQAAGVPVLAVRPPTAPGGPTVIDLDVAPDDTSQDAATDAVVAAHDVSRYDQQEEQARTAYDTAIAYLKQFEAQPSGSATNVQRDNALKACITVLKTQHQQLRAQGG